MQSFFLSLFLTVAVSQSYAATIRSARLDESQKNILIKVTYGGGCGKHSFSLDLKGCAESFPVQCQAELVHTSDDMCESNLSQVVVINLAKYKLNTSYYRGGSLTITGDQDWKTKKPSTATVILP